MTLDGALADRERVGDVVVRKALGDKRRDLTLAGGKTDRCALSLRRHWLLAPADMQTTRDSPAAQPSQEVRRVRLLPERFDLGDFRRSA